MRLMSLDCFLQRWSIIRWWCGMWCHYSPLPLCYFIFSSFLIFFWTFSLLDEAVEDEETKCTYVCFVAIVYGK
jgi:hypothetical protein